MLIKEVIEQQIDAIVAELLRARRQVGMATEKTEFAEIGSRLETAEFHLHDVQNNWMSLARSHAGERPIPAGAAHLASLEAVL
ncbi:MAG: hypothetical protein K8F27_07640 [Sulfuricellaceae bacterium]|nr:hypothetical protein [Sulfuricellaceae bacterium]